MKLDGVWKMQEKDNKEMLLIKEVSIEGSAIIGTIIARGTSSSDMYTKHVSPVKKCWINCGLTLTEVKNKIPDDIPEDDSK